MANKFDDVAKLKKLAQRLDRQFSILGVRFGFDGLVGLVPVLGDVITSAMGLYIILEARRLGATRWTMARMLLNWAIDFSVGALPVVGDIFDVAFKSNTKNLRMLIADLEKRDGAPRSEPREHPHGRGGLVPQRFP
jgi:hypothetical protein